VLVRDRAGKKPLYYWEAKDGFRFASEIKGLLATADATPPIDPQALLDYLAWTVIPAPATIYQPIRAIEPGHTAVVRDRQLDHLHRYWRLTQEPKNSVVPAVAIEQTDDLLTESVRFRLRSDVPVGVFLSGGIDSGLVTAIAARESPSPITTICVGFEDGPFDERPAAREIAQCLGTDHHEVLIRPDAADVLPTIARAYDQPFADSSAIPCYYLAGAARDLVKVVLTGDGGDEVFAGYRRYLAAKLNGWMGPADAPRVRPLWRWMARCLPTPRSYRTTYAFAHRLARGMGLDPPDRYMAWSVDGLDLETVHTLSRSPDWMRDLLPPHRYVDTAHGPDTGTVDQMLAHDFNVVLPNDFLVKIDIATMAHGLEARSPLLDHVLVETVSRYPESVRLGGRQTKPLLRNLAERYLPPTLCRAPKRGFEIPRLRWLREDLRALRDDVILSRQGLLADWFGRDALEHFLRQTYTIDPGRWACQVWVLLMLGLWDQHVHRAAP
jgi:asparagine synthase (glutamine-hydrolysing)